MTVRRIASRALFAVSIALALYLAYAHVTAWRRSAEYRATPVVVDFASQSELSSRFEIEASPGLGQALEGSSLRVRGTCEKSGARVVFRGPATRLVPTRASMRLRIRGSAPVDVMAGVERVEGNARELRFGAAVVAAGAGAGAEPNAELRFVGDTSTRGVRAEGDRVLARVSEPKLAVGADVPVHELALGIEPDLLAASGFVDGMLLRETAVVWEAGTLVRPAYSITCRDASAVAVDVELVQIRWQPLLRDTRGFELDDRFTGPIFDTRWRVTRADPDAVDTRIGLGHGLELAAKAKRVAGMMPILALVSPRFRAEPLIARAEADVETLRDGNLYLGVSNPYVGMPFFRMLDVGVFEKDGKLVPFTTGHFADDGQASLRTHEKLLADLPATSAGKVTLELTFLPESRSAIARVNGVVVSNEKVALQPYEDIVFHAGVNAAGPAAEARVRFERVALLRNR